ncbi:MAG: TetR/AcrR family transcriptional regulator [Solirubrobacteraceae bacterium]
MPTPAKRPQLPMVDLRGERRDAAANRARILAATRRLLRDEGLSATSIDRIAVEAGVGKGTVFRRFGDRAGLTAAVLDEHMRGFQDAFLSGPPPLGPGAPAGLRLEAFVDGLLAMLDGDLEVVLAAETASSASAGVVAGALTLHVRALVAELDPDLDAPVLADLILGSIAPPVIARLRARGVELAGQQTAARALLRGLTQPQDA